MLWSVKKKSVRIYLFTYLTRMLGRLKLASCESVSDSPRKKEKCFVEKLVLRNFKIPLMIPAHNSLLPLKAQDSADHAFSSLVSESLFTIIPPWSPELFNTWVTKRRKNGATPPNPSWISQKRNSSSPAWSGSGNHPITFSLPLLKAHSPLSPSRC